MLTSSPQLRQMHVLLPQRAIATTRQVRRPAFGVLEGEGEPSVGFAKQVGVEVEV